MLVDPKSKQHFVLTTLLSAMTFTGIARFLKAASLPLELARSSFFHHQKNVCAAITRVLAEVIDKNIEDLHGTSVTASVDSSWSQRRNATHSTTEVWVFFFFFPNNEKTIKKKKKN
jgi:hypothetical protein